MYSDLQSSGQNVAVASLEDHLDVHQGRASQLNQRNCGDERGEDLTELGMEHQEESSDRQSHPEIVLVARFRTHKFHQQTNLQKYKGHAAVDDELR